MRLHPPCPRGFSAAAALASLYLFFGLSHVHATCGSANCFLITGTQEGVASKGTVILDLSYRYIPQERKLKGSHGIAEVLTPKIDFENEEIEDDHHREISTQNSLVELDVSWSASNRFALSVSLPLINDRDHEHFDEVGTQDEFFTREDGSSGFGDARVGGRYAFLVRTKDLLVGGLAVKLPTGRYKLNDSEGAINEPTIQPGTGSTDLAVSLFHVHQWIPFRLESYLLGSHKLNRENDLDYQFGAEDLFSAGINYRPKEKITWSLQLNGRKTAHDRYLDQEVDSTGATLVNLTPGIRFESGKAAAFYAHVQAPIYQHVNDAQLAPRTGILVGVSRTIQ